MTPIRKKEILINALDILLDDIGQWPYIYTFKEQEVREVRETIKNE